MRFLAISLNIAQLSYACYLLLQSGQMLDTRLAVFYVLIVATPVASLVAIRFHTFLRPWFSSFLRRKTLEEQIRIEHLREEKHH